MKNLVPLIMCCLCYLGAFYLSYMAYEIDKKNINESIPTDLTGIVGTYMSMSLFFLICSMFFLSIVIVNKFKKNSQK